MFYHLPFARAFKTVLRLLNFHDINVFYHKKFWLCYGAVLRKQNLGKVDISGAYIQVLGCMDNMAETFR